MDIGRGDRKEQVEESWIPKTPFKPILPKPQITYTNRQGYQTDQDQLNRLRSAGFSSNFCEGPTFETWSACGNSNWEIAVQAKKGTTEEPWPEVLNGTKLKFTSLLALQDQASAAALTRSAATYRNGDYQLESNGLWSDNFRQNSQNDIPIYHGPAHDLNLAPGETADSISHKTPSQMAPVTPEKAPRAESEQFAQMQHSCTNGTVHQEINYQGSENTVAVVDMNRLQTDTQLQEQSKDSFGAVSTAVAENGNDVGPCETPQQKPRRRKHRPKVITEGKPRIRKPATPKPAPFTENQTGKRKYVRKKPLDKIPTTPPTESKETSTPPTESKETSTPPTESKEPSTPPTESKENSTGKRKYVRKKLLNEVSTPAVEPTGEPTSAQAPKPANHSCRRSLNFDIEGHIGYVNSECKPNSGGSQLPAEVVSGGYKSKSTVNFGRGIEVMVELTCDLSRSIDQMRQKYDSSPEKRASNEPLAATNHPPKRKWNDECQKNHEVGGDQVTTHDAHQKTSEIILYTSTQLPPRKINASNWESRQTMANEVRVNRTEWEIYNFSNQQDTCSTNLSGVYYNAISVYETGMGQNSTASSTSCVTSLTSSKDIAREEITGVLGSKMQSSSSILTQVEGPTRKRSRTPTRLRDVVSLTKIARGEFHPTSVARQPPMSYNVHQVAGLNISHACSEALAAEMHKQLRTKKRTKESVPLVNYESSSTNEQSHGKIMLNNRNQYSTMLLGTSPAEIWMSPLVQQLQQLDINRETSGIAYGEQNALVPYSALNEQNALVLYARDGTVVPFTGAFRPIKKRRPRPKVDLDQETSRVWKLLLGNINSQGIDGTDEEKAKWWKEEREVFSGRANSFIARMHLVQGDRRFTPWKGSVVDSVIGVFLTQNVSDHLSSSAFMSLAAHFPLKSTSHEAMRDSEIEKPIVCIPDLEDAINDMSNQSICDQSSMILHDSEPDEERDSNESSMSSTAIIHSTSGAERYYDSVEKRSTTVVSKTIDACYIEGKRSITNDAFSSQNSVVSSQNSADSPSAQTGDRNELLSDNNAETDQIDGSKNNCLNSSNTFTELLMKAARNELHEVPSHGNGTFLSTQNSYVFSKTQNVQNEKKCIIDISQSSLEVFMDQHLTSESKVVEETKYPDISMNNVKSLTKEQSSFTSESANQTDENNLNHSTHEASRYTAANDPPWSNIQEDMHLAIHSQVGIAKDHIIVEKLETQAENNELQQNMILPNLSGKHQDIVESSRALNILEKDSQKTTESDLTEHGLQEIKELNAKRKAKGRRVGGEIRDDVDWDALKKEAESNGRKREKTPNTMDSLDWEAVRCADVNKIANTIKERGMNNVLAARIKDFLNRLVREHGSIDLEWLRDVPPDKAKEYLLTIRGLGLKSVECVRLLTLHHLAFPVDTNVGRIAVRLGWVPLQPLPESLQLHLLELYPVLESIQQYLWPRLCKLDQKTLYELHYQMITFGKVFCTKNKPNCNACPMRGECRHFASAFASARLALPGPEEKSIVSAPENRTNEPTPAVMVDQLRLPLPQATEKSGENQQLESKQLSEVRYKVKKCEPIVEEPSSPEPECTQVTEIDIEDTICEEPDEIPTIKLNIEEFTQNLQTYMQNNMELQEGEMSKALVALTEEAASIPMPKLKNVSRLRTEHHVYELPDSHPLLQGLDRREPDDPCSYLLAIWTPGETANSIQPPESTCNLQEDGKLCDETTCFSCNSIREANSQIVRGTLLIPCRTAMRGSFPLNGTYFQVNEVFADHDSSLNPIDVPRSWIWNLPRRTVYFGTSIPTIFKGLTTEGIQHCFWKGYVCVRGFDQKTRAPRPLLARLHFPASKLNRTKGYDRDQNE